MKVKSINNKLNDASRKKLYLALTFILFSLFFMIFITQFSSPYAINSFAASAPSSVNYPVYLAYFSEPGCHDCDKAKIVLKDISAKYPDNIILKSFDISLSERIISDARRGKAFSPGIIFRRRLPF
jgi:thiol-disulfide isomerase/thioredoxin